MNSDLSPSYVREGTTPMTVNRLDPAESTAVATTAIEAIQSLAAIGKDLSLHWPRMRELHESCSVDRIAFSDEELELLTTTCAEARNEVSADQLEQLIREAVIRLRDIATVTQGSNPRTIFGRLRRGTTTVPGGGYADENLVDAISSISEGVPTGPADVVAVEVVRRAFLPQGTFPSSPDLKGHPRDGKRQVGASPTDIPQKASTTVARRSDTPTNAPSSPEQGQQVCDREAVRAELNSCLDELYPDPDHRRATNEGAFGQMLDRIVEHAVNLRIAPDAQGWSMTRRCRARLAIGIDLTIYELSDQEPHLMNMMLPHFESLLDFIGAEEVCAGLDKDAILMRTVEAGSS